MTYDSLSASQKEIITKDGLAVIKACPGSGKTLTVAARFAQKLQNWDFPNRGIAVISFTNVAWKEIDEYLKGRFQCQGKIGYPHFLGTIDSFVNRYLFLPFGHLLLQCKKRPELVGPPINNWEPIGNGWFWGNAECNKSRCKLNEFTYDMHGSVTNCSRFSHFGKCLSSHNICEKMKQRFNKLGYATQMDAAYYGMRILENFENIAKALVYRFPLIIIDEAQDSSEIQMRIIDLLINAGLKDVMLMGDPDQAIYEWRTANPSMFINKYNSWSHFTLNESWRSSQNICDFTFNLSSLTHQSLACNNDVKSFVFMPEIWAIKDDNYASIIEQFKRLCIANGLSFVNDRVAIITRGRDLLDEILGKTKKTELDPWGDDITRDITKCAFLFYSGSYKNSFTLLERVLCKCLTGKPEGFGQDLSFIQDELGVTKWRKEVYRLLSRLPKIDCPLGEWIALTSEILKSEFNDYSINLNIKKDRGKNKYSKIVIQELFASEKDATNINGITYGTVHSVKGETFDAILVIMKEHAGNAGIYRNLIQENPTTEEELRIVYVAITRPRKLLVMAVPNKDVDIWKQRMHIKN